MDHRANKFRVLTQGTYDRAHIIIFWTHAKMMYLEKTIILENVRKKTAARWAGLITAVMEALLEDLKGQIGDRSN